MTCFVIYSLSSMMRFLTSLCCVRNDCAICGEQKGQTRRLMPVSTEGRNLAAMPAPSLFKSRSRVILSAAKNPLLCRTHPIRDSRQLTCIIHLFRIRMGDALRYRLQDFQPEIQMIASNFVETRLIASLR